MTTITTTTTIPATEHKTDSRRGSQTEASVKDGISIYLEILLLQLEDYKKKLNSESHVEDPLLNKFYCTSIPDVPFSSFVERFTQMGNISDEVLVYSFIYLRRLIRNSFLKDAKTLHKLFATSVFVAYKYLNECDVWFLEDFSKLAGISTKELFSQELSFFVDLLNGESFVEDAEYSRGKHCLEAYSLKQF